MSRSDKENLLLALLGLATIVACCFLVLILSGLIYRGWPALDWEFLTAPASDFGRQGGVFYQILGTLILMIGAGLISVPIALASVLFFTEFSPQKTGLETYRTLIFTLNGVPTILFGLVGYLFFSQFLGIGVSWLTGVLILSIMILPTIQVSILEAVSAMPLSYRETGMALGLTPEQLIRSVVLPQCGYGVLTGTLLGCARAGGETAAIMFTATAFSGVQLPESLHDPVTTLQTHILTLSQEAIDPQSVTTAWGSGLVLMAIVFTLIAASYLIRLRVANPDGGQA